MVYVRQQLSVHLLVSGPVRAVHIRHIQIVTLVAPSLVEDLFELLPWLQVHPQRDIHSSLTSGRRIAICIYKEKSRHRRPGSRRRRTATASKSSRRAVQQLVSVGTHLVVRNRVRKHCRAPIAQSISEQSAAGRRTSRPSAPSSRRGLEVVHRSRRASLQLRILPLGNPRNVDRALLQSVKINLHSHRRPRTAVRLRRLIILSTI